MKANIVREFDGSAAGEKSKQQELLVDDKERLGTGTAPGSQGNSRAP
jgi:hypothetical protein